MCIKTKRLLQIIHCVCKHTLVDKSLDIIHLNFIISCRGRLTPVLAGAARGETGSKGGGG